jgi:hypothetical protein
LGSNKRGSEMMEKPKNRVKKGTEEYKILVGMLSQVWEDSPIAYKEDMIKNAGSKKKAMELLVSMVNDGIMKIEGRTNKDGDFMFKLMMYNFDAQCYKDINLRAKHITK